VSLPGLLALVTRNRELGPLKHRRRVNVPPE
jgi:hypothetical protein